ncbi:MAG TPA: hypothetical protein VF883_25440 [Thermoanaerobaculia bacterium]|jgi:hypothetical protein
MRIKAVIVLLGVLLVVGAEAQQLPVGYKIAFIETTPAPKTDAIIRSNTDYVSVFLDSVFINRDEKFLTKNNFAIDVALEVDGKALSIPVYAQRDPKVNGKLGLIHYGLLNSIPASGKPVKLGIRILRRDVNDPIRKTIDLLTGKETESLLKTYAASAIPYIGMVGAVANSLYQAFGAPKEGDVLFFVAPITFSPSDGDAVDSFTLRDATAIIYKSTQTLDTKKLSVDGAGTVLLDDKPLTGMPYVTVRLQKFARRQDYTGREWQRRYEQAILAVASTPVANGNSRDFGSADRLFSESLVLLSSDFDFTLTDRNNLASAYSTAYAKAKQQVNAGNVNAVVAAIDKAMVTPIEVSALATPVTPDIGATVSPLFRLHTLTGKVLSTVALQKELEKTQIDIP